MRIETLGAHDLSAFSSGAEDLDEWLHRRAERAQQVGDAVVRVALTEAGRVVGFQALCSGSVERSLADGPLRRNAPDPVPVLVLARLAVDSNYQGRGVGAALLADVVERSRTAAAVVGFRALLIHCRDEAALAFYSRLLPVRPLPGNPLRVYVAMSVVSV